jgi:PhnB protein
MADEPKGAPGGVTPHISINGGRGAEAAAFYVKAFGAVELFRQPAQDGKRLLHCHLSINGGSLMLADDFPEMRGGGPAPDPAGFVLHLQVPDADAAWNAAIEAGAVETFPLALQFWGDRYGQVRDPFGVTWSIASTPAKAD